MTEQLQVKVNEEFKKFLSATESIFEDFSKKEIDGLAVRKGQLSREIADYNDINNKISEENKSLKAEFKDLSDRVEKNKNSIASLEDRKLKLAEDVLAAENKIKEAALAMDELQKKQEALEDKDVEIKAKIEVLREKEARLNKIFNRLNQ